MLDGAIIAARFLEYAAALPLFGLLLYFLHSRWTEGKPTSSRGVLVLPWRWLLAPALIALAATIAWVMAETALLAGEPQEAFNPATVWSVLWETGFGRVHLFRIGMLALSAAGFLLFVLSRRVLAVQAIVGGAVVASFAWTGHGARDDGLRGIVHLGSDVAHLLAAAIWIGALIFLSASIFRSIRTGLEEDSRATCRCLETFSGIGFAVVAVLTGTGILNSWYLIGPARWRDLFITNYGIVLLVKLVLFAAMLAFASANRFILTPQLGAGIGVEQSSIAALRRLRASLLGETLLAFLVLAAVAYLGTLAPPTASG